MDSDFEGGDELKLSETEVIIENLKQAGFPEDDILVQDDGSVYVGRDAHVTLQASRELAGITTDGPETNETFRQYRTTNTVDTTTVNTICINPSNAWESNALMLQALDTAIARYNNEGLQFTIGRDGAGCSVATADAVITGNLDNSGGGSAGFPSGGLPYGTINVDQNLASNYGVPVATHVIVHELGHCVGFRHTDYYNRSISCGSGGNEGDAGVGAIHIPGTPTDAVSGGSVMNSCFSASSTGQWTASDVTALDCLYDSGTCAPPPPPSYSDIDTHGNQSASAGVETNYGPYDASTYDAMRFSISGGTGDADLYVRFGAAPTTASYDCRPYIAGNNETCEFNPSSNGNYYVMIRAYSAYSGVTLNVEAAGGAPPPPAEVCDNGVDDDGDGDTDCADSDCSADPACQPDPEVCDNGVDDDGDGDTDCADSDCSADPSCQPDPEVCDDGVDNDGDGDTDCADSDCTGDPACQPGGWSDLYSNDFESGWGGFTDGGSDARRSSNDSAYAHGGTYCARIRDNSGSVSSFYDSSQFDLSGYSTLEVDFWYYARSMENGEDFFVELWDGGGWSVIGNYARGTDFNNNTMNNETITVDVSGLNGTSGLRFRNDASGNSDWIYVDDITVRAQ